MNQPPIAHKYGGHSWRILLWTPDRRIRAEILGTRLGAQRQGPPHHCMQGRVRRFVNSWTGIEQAAKIRLKRTRFLSRPEVFAACMKSSQQSPAARPDNESAIHCGNSRACQLSTVLHSRVRGRRIAKHVYGLRWLRGVFPIVLSFRLSWVFVIRPVLMEP